MTRCLAWQETMIAFELEALDENKTWNIVELPHGKKSIGSKWTFKFKQNSDHEVISYKAREVIYYKA